MKKSVHIIVASFYLGMMTLSGVSCTHEKNELVHDHAHEHGHEGEEHDGHDHEHEHVGHEGHDHGSGDEIVLEPERAEQFGVEVMAVSPSTMNDVVKVVGTVGGTASGTGSVSAPTAGIFTFNGDIVVGSRVSKGQVIGTVTASAVSGGDANQAARATLEAAKQELDRLKPLYEQQLVTAERYNQAVMAYNVAKASYSPSAASGRVTAPSSGTITELSVGQGQYVEPGTVIARIADGSTLTLTLDVPDRYAAMIPAATDARVVVNGTGEVVDLSNLGGRKITTGATTTLRPGYLPVVFTFNSNGLFSPGAVVETYLLGAPRTDVITVPVEAISEQQGNYFVYVRVDEEGYLKSPVTLGARDGRNIEILSGVHPGDEVVVKGVTAVKLAEKSGVVPEGHSHSH